MTKEFVEGDKVTVVLDGVNFFAARGEFLMLVGPSGSGKTTLLSIVGCALRPTSGAVRLYGEDVARLSEAELPALRRSHIGFIFQGHNLVASMSATENVVFQMQLRGYGRSESLREAQRLLERVGLEKERDRLPRDMSGGQRQRVAIARAVAGAPPLILADEPTASLDHKTGGIVVELLRNLADEGGHTVVVVTHDPRIFKFADRIEYMQDGHIVPREEASIPMINVSDFGG